MVASSIPPGKEPKGATANWGRMLVRNLRKECIRRRIISAKEKLRSYHMAARMSCWETNLYSKSPDNKWTVLPGHLKLAETAWHAQVNETVKKEAEKLGLEDLSGTRSAIINRMLQNRRDKLAMEAEKRREKKKEKVSLERERLKRARLQKERLRRERSERERLRREILQRERLDMESCEQERCEQERREQERLEMESCEPERTEMEVPRNEVETQENEKPEGEDNIWEEEDEGLRMNTPSPPNQNTILPTPVERKQANNSFWHLTPPSSADLHSKFSRRHSRRFSIASTASTSTLIGDDLWDEIIADLDVRSSAASRKVNRRRRSYRRAKKEEMLMRRQFIRATKKRDEW